MSESADCLKKKITGLTQRFNREILENGDYKAIKMYFSNDYKEHKRQTFVKDVSSVEVGLHNIQQFEVSLLV